MSLIALRSYWQRPPLGKTNPTHIAPIELATSMEEMETKKHELHSGSSEAFKKLHLLFDEMMQMCLWYVSLLPFLLGFG